MSRKTNAHKIIMNYVDHKDGQSSRAARVPLCPNDTTFLQQPYYIYPSDIMSSCPLNYGSDFNRCISKT